VPAEGGGGAQKVSPALAGQAETERAEITRMIGSVPPPVPSGIARISPAVVTSVAARMAAAEAPLPPRSKALNKPVGET
jgi:hypothetical protein